MHPDASQSSSAGQPHWSDYCVTSRRPRIRSSTDHAATSCFEASGQEDGSLDSPCAERLNIRFCTLRHGLCFSLPPLGIYVLSEVRPSHAMADKKCRVTVILFFNHLGRHFISDCSNTMQHEGSSLWELSALKKPRQ